MSRRRRKPDESTEFHADERWAVPYGDMLTVLMCLFIVLYATSSPDAVKYEQLKQSLASGFGQVEAGKVDTAEGIVVPAANVNETGEHEELSDAELAAKEVQDLKTIEAEIRAALEAKGLQDAVRFGIDENGLTVRIVSSEAFFGPDSANLQNQAIQVLEAVTPPIKKSGRSVGVEGHTAKQPGNQPLRDWELSTDRAVNVVRYMTERGGVDGTLIAASGYAGNRPVIDSTAPEDMKANRRVDVLVESDESDSVKALIASEGEAAAGVPPAKEDAGGH